MGTRLDEAVGGTGRSEVGRHGDLSPIFLYLSSTSVLPRCGSEWPHPKPGSQAPSLPFCQGQCSSAEQLPIVLCVCF